ncbi:MAG TPA: lasso peptide biosynthesis B2 protein [Gemmatimonadaceae bacterium]
MSQSILPAETVVGNAGEIAARLPSTARCGTSLIMVIAVLRTCGFVRALRLIRWMARDVRLSCDEPHETAESVARRVALIAAFYPGRARCLEQSLTLYWLLRRMGMDAVIRLGVQPVSFAAHAWVEYQRIPVHEGELVATVLPFSELPI